MKNFCTLAVVLVLVVSVSADGELYKFEGRVVAPPTVSNQKEFYAQTTILVDSKYMGHVR